MTITERLARALRDAEEAILSACGNLSGYGNICEIVASKLRESLGPIEDTLQAYDASASAQDDDWVNKVRDGSFVFRNAAREYLDAVQHLFALRTDGACLAERSPTKDTECLHAFQNLNYTGKRLKQCCDALDKLTAAPAAPTADEVKT